MCMKNLNMTAVFCDIIANHDNPDVSLGDIGNKRFFITTENEVRKISQLSLAVFINATQAKGIKTADPDSVFSFEDEYEIRVRLTETYSGEFKDLTSFVVKPSDRVDAEGLCRCVFQHTHLCIFSNVALPEKREKERFVIKLVVRRCGAENDSWAVQSIFPIKFENE